MSQHTLLATVEEGSATLNRVLSLFRQRSFAIESLSIGKTNEHSIIELLRAYGIRELVRTGVVAMTRGHAGDAAESHHALRLVS